MTSDKAEAESNPPGADPSAENELERSGPIGTTTRRPESPCPASDPIQGMAGSPPLRSLDLGEIAYRFRVVRRMGLEFPPRAERSRAVEYATCAGLWADSSGTVRSPWRSPAHSSRPRSANQRSSGPDRRHRPRYRARNSTTLGRRGSREDRLRRRHGGGDGGLRVDGQRGSGEDIARNGERSPKWTRGALFRSGVYRAPDPAGTVAHLSPRS